MKGIKIKPLNTARVKLYKGRICEANILAHQGESVFNLLREDGLVTLVSYEYGIKTGYLTRNNINDLVDDLQEIARLMLKQSQEK